MSIGNEFKRYLLSEALEHSNELLVLREGLIMFRDKGMDKKSMLKNLEELRETCESEDDEDVLMDLMDYVVGFCSPHLSIFYE